MIKLSELRIGNLLFDAAGNIASVIQIGPYVGTKCSTEDRGYVSVEECAPIPLTPDWLERCGFEKAKEEDGNFYTTYTILKLDGGIVKEEDGWYHRITDVDGYYEQRVGIKIEYVHQLQNKYFDQTGEELQIKMP